MWRCRTARAPRRWPSGRRKTISSSTGSSITPSRSIRRSGSPTTFPGSRTTISASAGSDSAAANYFGTYAFDNLQAYLANRPSNYARRLGDPNLSYQMLQAGFYVQDDIRPRKNLTFSPGVRYEVQTHVRDYHNFGPRFGTTW